MYENDATLRAEFVRESLEIIAHVSSACARIQTSNEPALEREEVDRGLHTLKGNAGALGFDELCEAASFVLEQLRERRTADPRLAKREMSLVLRFMTVARQFLFLLSNDRAPLEGFFVGFCSPSRAASAQAALPREGIADEIADKRLAAEIEQILESVPALDPDPRRLLRFGRRPAATELETPPPPHPTHPLPEDDALGTSGGAGVAAAAFSGFGFEASCTLEALRAIPEDAVAEAWQPKIQAATDLLSEIQHAAIRTRAVPIERYLNDMAMWGRRMAMSVDDRLDIEVIGNGVKVLPGVGDLLCMLLREVLDLTLPLRDDDWTEGQPAIRFEARRGERLRLYVSGSPSLQRSTTREKIRLCATLQLLEEIDGSLENGNRSEEVVLTLQDQALYDIPVMVIGAETGAVAIGAHRLLDLVECEPSEVTGDTFAYAGETIPLLDLSLVETDLTSPPPADAACAVMVFGTDAGPRGVAARGAIQRRELLVKPHAERSRRRTLGFCISPEDGIRIPLLLIPLH